MLAADGKQRLTDAADTETILRIIESVPSPKAEPFKQWLAGVGSERPHAMGDPMLAADRMRRDYERLGYGDAWITERLKNVVARNELTEEWCGRGADERRGFARLTDTLSKGTFDVTTTEHKAVKGLRGSANLRDSMTPLELALTSLADVTVAEMHQTGDLQGFSMLHRDAKQAGDIAGDMRRTIEEALGKPVVSSENQKRSDRDAATSFSHGSSTRRTREPTNSPSFVIAGITRIGLV